MSLLVSIDAQVGVCYGRVGDGLPSQQDVVNLYRRNGITRMRIYGPDQATLQALKGTNIELMIGVPNDALQSLNDQGVANTWVRNNIQNYPDVNFKYIAVGNEVDPNNGDSRFVNFVLPAMRNVQNAINAAGLRNQIKVSTATYTGLLGVSYPPSNGAFRNNVQGFMEPIIRFLAGNNSPMLANIYPYFANPISNLPYALFTAPGTVVTDPNNGLQYSNIFDAMLDAHYAAQARLGGGNVQIVVSDADPERPIWFPGSTPPEWLDGIALQQLKGFLGIKHFTKKTDIISVMKSVFGSIDHGWNWQTIVIGASFLAFLLSAKYLSKKNKKLFWVSAIAPLISVILSTLFVYITHAEKQGVAIVKHIEKGINPPSVNEIYFSGENLLKGFRIGIVAGMIALTEAVAIGRTFASMKDYQVDGNKEMIALGTMNVVGSMTSCYVATGSFSRSAVNYMAGCQTAVSNIVMSLVVFLTLKFLTPLFEYTPNAILSSIIISAVIGLIDYEAAILIWKIDKFDFVACLGAFLGVVFASVEIGLLIAVTISFAKILLQVTRPRTAILGRIPMTTVYRNIQQYPEATKVPGVLIVRVDSAIYFSNSNYTKERILRWLTEEEDHLRATYQPKVQSLIIEMSPVTDIDTSGIHAFEELYRSLVKRDVQLVLANPGRLVLDKLYASGFPDLIGENKIFLTVADAVLTCAPKILQQV